MNNPSLLPCINDKNEFVLTLRDYVKENLHPHLTEYSFISIIGKPNETKYKIIHNLFGIENNEQDLQNQRLNLSHSQHGKHFIQDVNVNGFDLYKEKEYKTVFFCLLVSRHLIFTLNLAVNLHVIKFLTSKDLKLFNIQKLLTMVAASFWSTKGENSDPKKITLLIDSSEDVLGYIQAKGALAQNLTKTWNEIHKPSELQDTDLHDIIDFEIKTFTQYELDTKSPTNKLLELSIAVSSPFKHRTSQPGSTILGPYSEAGSLIKLHSLKDSGVQEDFGRRSDSLLTGKPIKKGAYPFEFFQEFYEELWISINSTSNTSDLYTINCNERMYKLLESEFESKKAEILDKAIYQVIELRKRIEEEDIVLDFAVQAKRIYEEAAISFIRLGFNRSLAWFFDGNEKWEQERKIFHEKIEFEVFNLFEMQVNYLKERVIDDYFAKITQAKQRFKTETGFLFTVILSLYEIEYYLSLKEVFEREEARLITEIKGILGQLKVTVPGFRLRWDIEHRLEEIKKVIEEFKQKTFEGEIKSFMRNLTEKTRNQLKDLIHLDNIESNQSLWEEIQTIFLSVVEENAEMLRKVIQSNSMNENKSIEEAVVAYKRDSFEYILSLLRKQVSNIESIIYQKFAKQFEDNYKRKERMWRWRGPAKAFMQLQLSWELLTKASIGVLDNLKHMKIDKTFNQEVIKATDSPGGLLTEREYKQIYKSFSDKARDLLEIKKKQLNRKFRSDLLVKGRREFIFWTCWILFLYIYIHNLESFFLFALLVLLIGVKVLQYGGVFNKLMDKVIKYVQEIFEGEDSPLIKTKVS